MLLSASSALVAAEASFSIARRLPACFSSLPLQVISLSISLKHAQSQHAAQQWQCEALQRKLSCAEAEGKVLESKLAAVAMEAAGTSSQQPCLSSVCLEP